MREYISGDDWGYESRADAIGEAMEAMSGRPVSGDPSDDSYDALPWPLPNVWLGTSEHAELATLAAQAERYREALETAREALNWRDNEIRLGIRDPLGEEEIRAVGERFGYGVLMSTASRLWYEKAGSGAFAVGHCIAIVEKADRVAAAALEKEAHHD